MIKMGWNRLKDDAVNGPQTGTGFAKMNFCKMERIK